MVQKKLSKIRREARSLDSKCAVLSHRLRARGVYCEAGVEWDISDVPSRHDDAMVITSHRLADANEQFYTGRVEYVCDAQLRVKDAHIFSAILEDGLSYRIMSADGQGDGRVYTLIMWVPKHNAVASVDESDDVFIQECMDIIQSELSDTRSPAASDTPEPGEADDASGTSGTSERELSERIRKALH